MPFSLLRGDWWCWMCQDSSMQRVWVWLWASITMAFDKSYLFGQCRCGGIQHIGQTGRSLDHCLREHRRALKNGDVGSSALAEHVFSANHQVDLSKAMVIDAHNHTQTRCMLESWHIQHHQSPLNMEKGTLPGLYAALLS